MMRWEDERYVRIYTRDTPDWMAMEWQGRAVFYELSRKVDRTGFVPLGKSGTRGLAGLLHMPVEVVEVGIKELKTDGCVVAVEGGLLIRNYIEAQEAHQSDAARKRTQRERDRNAKRDGLDQAAAPDSVTPRDGASQNVTECHGESRAVTASHEQSRRVTPSRAEPSRTEPNQIPTPPTPPPPAGGPSKRRRSRGGEQATKEPEAHVRYAQAYAEGITLVTGQPFTVPLRGGSKTALWQMATTYAKADDGTALDGDVLLGWFRDTAAEYRRGRATARRDLEGGFSPAGCQTWLDAGRPVAPAAPEARTSPAAPAGDVERFRTYWLEQYTAAPFGYGNYVEAEGEASREAYGQLLALGTKQHSLDDKHSGKAWAKHWVDSFLADADQWIAGRRHSFAILVATVRREPARWGQPGTRPAAAANTGARSPRPTGTLQPEGGWTPHVPPIDLRALAVEAQAELDAEAAAGAGAAGTTGDDAEGKAA